MVTEIHKTVLVLLIFSTSIAQIYSACEGYDDEQIINDNDIKVKVKWEFTLSPSLNAPDLHFEALSFASDDYAYIYSMNATLVMARHNLPESLCAVVFIRESSEFVLASNALQNDGTADKLARITDLKVTKNYSYSRCLERPQLVTGMLIVSTLNCTLVNIEVMKADVELESDEVRGADFSGILANIDDTGPCLAREVLLIDTEDNCTVLTTPGPQPGSGSTNSKPIAIAVVMTVISSALLITVIVMTIVVYRLCRMRNQRLKRSSSLRHPLTARPDSLMSNHVYSNYRPRFRVLPPTPVEVNSSRSRNLFPDHDYEGISYSLDGTLDEVSNEVILNSETDQEDAPSVQFVPQYGIQAPDHDFTEFNRQRSEQDWKYSRRKLIYIRELGEGQFGKVVLMKAKGIAGFSGLIPVAVKTLSSTEPTLLNKFFEEVELMKKFIHPNIVSLLGAETRCAEGAPLMVLEYMPYGDLHEFLQTYGPKDNLSPSPITESHFYSFAMDVARALEFLALHKYVHRDVAARNCLVGSGLRIKIADFGLARGVYDKDYYRVTGKAVLPVRWMAPESLLYGLFTTASDVWSYGVLLWEIVTYGQLPLIDMEVQEILEEAENGTLQHSRPEQCPNDIDYVICQCHRHEAEERPRFSEILQVFTERTIAVVASTNC